MCLEIRQKTQRNEMKRKYLAEHKPNAQGFIVGYKTFKPIGNQFVSFYMECPVDSGIVKSDRFPKNLSDEEKEFGEISSGCHFFLTLEDAESDLNSYVHLGIRKPVVRKIYFKPEDLVAVGKFNRWCDSGVVMKYRLY